MKKLLFISCLLCFCHFTKAQIDNCGISKFDHIVFFVSDSSIEGKLDSILTIGEKLSTLHTHQGTLSHFYLFYNTFLELIYPVDTSAITMNSASLGSFYLNRWSFEGDVCRLGIGLINIPFDSTCAHFHAYYSKDNPGYYLMSKNNIHDSDVFLYSTDALHAYQSIESLEEFDSIVPAESVQDFKNYTIHPSGIQKLTKLIIHKPNEAPSSNFDAISEFNMIEIKNSENFKYILEFDNKKQNRTLVVLDWLEIRY